MTSDIATESQNDSIPVVFINSKDTVSSLVTEHSSLSSEQSKPKDKSRKDYGKSGLINTGNTCYMNAALQAISHTYLFRHYLFTNFDEIERTLLENAPVIYSNNKIISPVIKAKIMSPDYKVADLTDTEREFLLNGTMTFQVAKLLRGMWTKNCVVNPLSFRAIFSHNSIFYGYAQHDSQEAYSCIIQRIQEELATKKNIRFKTTKPGVDELLKLRNKTVKEIEETKDEAQKKIILDNYLEIKKQMPEESIVLESYKEMKKYFGNSYSRITEIFSGFFRSSTTCPDCGFSSNKFDYFLHLPLELVPKAQMSIYDCMDMFCKEETLDEKNMWECEKCVKKVRAVKQMKMWSNPVIMVVQIKRFGFLRSGKDSRFVHFPVTDFDIGKMISKENKDDSKCYKYDLYAVVNHTGSLNSGHYFTYCKDEDSNKWFKFDDNDVLPMPEIASIDRNAVVTSNAYLLFYIRKDMLC
jgi:ubiquitin C-terminal hydrolase